MTTPARHHPPAGSVRAATTAAGSGSRQRCVMVTRLPPLPGFGGTPIRIAATVESLASEFDLTVICAAPLTERQRELVLELCDSVGAEVRFADHQFLQFRDGSLDQRVRLTVGALSPWVEGRWLGVVPDDLMRLIRGADLLWVCRLSSFLLHRLPRPDHGAVVIDVDDIEERVIDRLTNLSPMRRWILNRKTVASRWRQLRSADAALLCSDLDAGRMAAPCPIRVLPNTYPTTSAGRADGEPVGGASEHKVLLVASMSYDPNREGAQWLLRDVWPLVRASVPDAQLEIAGVRSAELEVPEGADGVTVLGEVADVAPLLRTSSVVVAPIPFGSGTRVKILEAFAFGLPVVSTTAGAEGIDAEHGSSILIADDAAAFASAVISLVVDPDLARRISHGGRALFDDIYAVPQFRARVLSIAHSAMADSLKR